MAELLKPSVSQPAGKERIASSELADALLGDTSRYRDLLKVQQERLIQMFPDEMVLDRMFGAIDSRIINICPMVLCAALVEDLGVEPSDALLTGLGLAMFSISTHDDLVDELPRDRVEIAGLTYAGNIATLEGIKLLVQQGHSREASIVIDYINKNHYFQTKIAGTLWRGPANEQGYLDAISHTKYWVAIGLKAALIYAGREDLHPFVDEYSECYGTTCQLYDDVREISDDIQNGYWSLPISTALEQELDLSNPEHIAIATNRSRELAESLTQRALSLCGADYPKLRDLIERIERVGKGI